MGNHRSVEAGKRVILGALATFLLASAAAAADVQPGNVPAQSISAAYPIVEGTTYHGSFQPDTAAYHDVDYLSLSVPSAGETVEFTVQNTTALCLDPNDHWCPVYATLMDQSDNQVGGASSAAGTVATYTDTETFDWTFNAPGTYYLLMESNGDEAPGNPSYAVSFRMLTSPRPGTGSGGPSTPAALVRSLLVSPLQHGSAVRATVTLGQQSPFAIEQLLLARAGGKAKPIAILTRASLSAGRRRLVLPLPARYRRLLKARHRLSLIVEFGFLGAGGTTRAFTRRVTLTA